MLIRFRVVAMDLIFGEGRDQDVVEGGIFGLCLSYRQFRIFPTKCCIWCIFVDCGTEFKYIIRPL